MALSPDDRRGPMLWTDAIPEMVKTVNSMRASLALRTVTYHSQNETIEILQKRVAMLEAERGPGLSAPKPLQTCDVGADWE